MGFDVLVPIGEAGIFADPVQHFRERQSYIVYDNIWDQFAPIEPARVTPVHDYGRSTSAGLVFTVVPLPGVTPHHTGYALAMPDGRPVVFSGEAIHSPGRVARIAPLQYDYNDLGGAVNAHWSAGALRRLRPGGAPAEPRRADRSTMSTQRSPPSRTRSGNSARSARWSAT